MKKNLRRRVRVCLDPKRLAELFERENAWQVFQGLPGGSIVIGAGHDLQTNQIVLFVEHPSFAEVAEGMMPPELAVGVVSTKNNSEKSL